MINLQGKILLEKELIQGYGILQPQEELPTGLYLIRVTGQYGGTRTQKVLWE